VAVTSYCVSRSFRSASDSIPLHACHSGIPTLAAALARAAPSSAGSSPIVVCVDASEHAHHVVEKLDPFLCPSRGRVIVAHFETETPANTTIAQKVADGINQRFGIPTEARSIPEESAAAGIAILAAREQSQLVITHSWHRPVKGEPSPSSTSLSSVAHVPCPVVILGE